MGKLPEVSSKVQGVKLLTTCGLIQTYVLN